jgi:external thioesterase TEII
MAKPQLFMLHSAGGSCYSFHFMLSFLQDFEVVALELPGRGKRVKELLVNDFNIAAQDIYNQLRQKLASPTFLIYGHSMGAYLALKVASMLEEDAIFPHYLVVSGNAGPGIDDSIKRSVLQKKELLTELAMLGGMEDAFLADDELVEFFLPILRSDFEVVENNGISSELSVNTPLYAIMGDHEWQVNQISNWGNFTRSSFKYEVLEGGHFFIHKHPERVAFIIKECFQHST